MMAIKTTAPTTDESAVAIVLSAQTSSLSSADKEMLDKNRNKVLWFVFKLSSW